MSDFFQSPCLSLHLETMIPSITSLPCLDRRERPGPSRPKPIFVCLQDREQQE